MFICLSFIGKLPEYIIDCVHQIKLYSKLNIYLITDDLQSEYVQILKEKYKVDIIDYAYVYCQDFMRVYNNNQNRFPVVPGLKERKDLYMRSYERFYILHSLMKKMELTDCFFMEIDNLIYDDPLNWLDSFKEKGIAIMYDSEKRFSSGVMYVKDCLCLRHLLTFMTSYVQQNTTSVQEMLALGEYHQIFPELIQVLPTYWNTEDDKLDKVASNNFNKYGNIFDAAAIGIYLLGFDSHHTNGVIVKNIVSQWSQLKCNNYKFKWEEDEYGLKKPYIWTGEKWILINNLHVHSKDLKNGLSKIKY